MTDIFIAPKNRGEDRSPVLSYSESARALSVFCKNPKGVSFQTQKHNELIILFLRAHLITNVSWLVLSLILITLPIIALIFLPKLGINFSASSQTIRFTGVYIFFYCLIVFSYVFINFLHWFYNIFLVTTERIVDVDYSDIVMHNIASTNLNHIEDVNYTQSGFIPTLFNYGNLFVQTAGNERNFEALSISKPREATHIIGNLIGKTK